MTIKNLLNITKILDKKVFNESDFKDFSIDYEDDSILLVSLEVAIYLQMENNLIVDYEIMV